MSRIFADNSARESLTSGIYRTMALIWILTFFLAILPSAVSVFDDDLKKSLDEFVRTVMKCRDVTGVSLALVAKHKVAYTVGYGVANVATGAPMTDETLINLASLTKSFTSTLASDAVAKGLVEWDTPIKEYLGPEFKLQNEFRTNRTSIRDLLSHQLGMPSYYGLNQAVLNLTVDQLVQRIQYFPVRQQFRSRYMYCNYLYVLAGVVLHRASGQVWGDAIVDNILKPLGMNASRVVSQLSDLELETMATSCSMVNHTCVLNKERLLIPVLQHAQPAGGVYSTARDMAKWLVFHLKQGKSIQGLQVLDRYALRETYRPHAVLERVGISRAVFPVANLDFTYALGWMNGVYRGYKKLSHTGSFSGFRLQQTLLPEEGVGVWVAITSFKPGHQTIIRDMITMFSLDLLLGKTLWLGSFTACTYPEPWKRFTRKTKAKVKLPSIVADAGFNKTMYVGEYFHKAFGKFHIYMSNGTLRFEFGLLFKGTLQPSASRDLMYQHPEEPYEVRRVSNGLQYGHPMYFKRHANGSIHSIEVPFLEPQIPPVFVRDDPEAMALLDSAHAPDIQKMASLANENNASFKCIVELAIGLYVSFLLMV